MSRKPLQFSRRLRTPKTSKQAAAYERLYHRKTTTKDQRQYLTQLLKSYRADRENRKQYFTDRIREMNTVYNRANIGDLMGGYSERTVGRWLKGEVSNSFLDNFDQMQKGLKKIQKPYLRHKIEIKQHRKAPSIPTWTKREKTGVKRPHKYYFVQGLTIDEVEEILLMEYEQRQGHGLWSFKLVYRVKAYFDPQEKQLISTIPTNLAPVEIGRTLLKIYDEDFRDFYTIDITPFRFQHFE